MLDCIHCGCTTEESLATLTKRLIDVSVKEKFWELSKQGKSPVCLFAKRKSCKEVNKRMLAGLPSEKGELPLLQTLQMKVVALLNLIKKLLKIGKIKFRL